MKTTLSSAANNLDEKEIQKNFIFIFFKYSFLNMINFSFYKTCHNFASYQNNIINVYVFSQIHSLAIGH